MSVDELLKRVRLVINEAEYDSEVTLLSVDTRRIDDCIKGLLPSAVSFIQKNKGSSGCRVNTKSVTPSSLSVTDNGSGGGQIVLPNDFVELVSLQLEGWLSPVCRLHPNDSREAAWLQNTYTRAGACRPVGIAAFTSSGARCAMLFPLPGGNGSKVRHFVYEAIFNAADGLNGYDSGMEDAVVYACASLLYTMFERYDAANAMLSQALAACGGRLVKQE